MAAFSGRADFYTQVATPYVSRAKYLSQAGINTLLRNWSSNWLFQGDDETGASVPSTAVATSNSTTGNFVHRDAVGGSQLWVVQADVCANGLDGNDMTGGMLMLIDRLSHQGGLDANTASTQTTNLPTAALTRYTDGVGVMAALEVYTAVGTTRRGWTVSYTNQAGTASRTSTVSGSNQASCIGGSSPANQPGGFSIIPLQSGDTGVKSVESVALAAGTGTSGNFGITLFKPLMLVPMRWRQSMFANGLLSLGGQIPEVLASACLCWIYATDLATNNFALLDVRLGQA